MARPKSDAPKSAKLAVGVGRAGFLNCLLKAQTCTEQSHVQVSALAPTESNRLCKKSHLDYMKQKWEW